ncbi:MAG: hypothetical protein RLZ25_348 [Pseudomonadota bacterium]|jgi:hypothetical protein
MSDKKTKSIKLAGETANQKTVAPSKARSVSTPSRALNAKKLTASGKRPSPSKEVSAKTTPQTPIEKVKKERKTKLIRDSFKFPEWEYRSFDALKSRCLAKGQSVKKSELVRAGILALASMSDAELLKSISSVEKLKTGRPAK